MEVQIIHALPQCLSALLGPFIYFLAQIHNLKLSLVIGAFTISFIS